MPLRHFIYLFVALLLMIGCSGEPSRTTATLSSSLATLAERQAFLERYVTFRRTYTELEFSIEYLDGGAGAFPSPSEWDIRISAKVPPEELSAWIAGLSATSSANTDWASAIPEAPPLGGFSWFEDSSRLVGIDRAAGRVLYRSWAS